MEDQSAEKSFEKYILQQFAFDSLPPDVKKRMGNSKDTWKQHVCRYSIRHQLRWKTNLVRTFITDEKQYYLEVLRFSRTQYMLYPYHIADVLVKGLRVTPFRFYLEMMFDIMSAEKSYDVLPNFTAADCVRVLGIGRNQYIDIMNKVKAKAGFANSWIFKKKRDVIRQYLPPHPVEADIQHWWVVSVGYVSEDDIQQCNETEHKIVDNIIDTGPKFAGQLSRAAVLSLMKRELVYLDVPVENNDQIIVPPLQNFVMNRVSGDYFENLLYKLFVSVDERTTVEKLAKILDIDIQLVKQAISMYIRLGLAHKKNVEPLLRPNDDDIDDIAKSMLIRWHPSWTQWAQNLKNNPTEASPYYQRLLENEIIQPAQSQAPGSPEPPRPNGAKEESTVSSAFSSTKQPVLTEADQSPSEVHHKRIAFLFDSSLAAFLMMGNLGENLKAHAVTLFEAGKMPDERIEEFLKELDTVAAVSEGEAQRYFDHAITLRNTLRFLRYNPNLKLAGADGGVDLLRAERLNSLDHAAKLRILQRSYALLVSMAPISTETLTITSHVPRHFGPVVPEIASVWFKMYLYHLSGLGPESMLFPKGTRVTKLPDLFKECETVHVQTWDHDPNVVNAQHLLPALNDWLLQSPVLVQAHSYTSSKPKTVNLPFPMESTLVEYASTEREYTEDTLHTHPSLKALQKHANLDVSCGFVKMKLIDNPRIGVYKWVPQEIHYGVPLFSIQLNRAVCERIDKFNVFSERNLAIYSRRSRELALRLLDFIAQCNGSPVELELGVTPFPSRVVQFPPPGKSPIEPTDN